MVIHKKDCRVVELLRKIRDEGASTGREGERQRVGSVFFNPCRAHYSLVLDSLDGLDLGLDVVGGGLEGLEGLLDLVNDGLVLEDLAVVGKVDGGLLLLKISQDTAGLLVAFAERAQGGNGLGLEAEGGGQLGPVNVGSSRLCDGHD